MLSGPDEPSQIIAAAADVRGQIVKKVIKGQSLVIQKVKVPETFAYTRNESRCLYNPSVAIQPANCQLPSTECPKLAGTNFTHCGLPLVKGNKTISGSTYSGRYPPLYFLLVGLPTLISSSPHVIYLMRLVSLLMSGVFIALAIFSAYRWSKSPLLPVGISLSLTPMAFYLSAVVNPNGFEIACSLCLWVSGMIIFTEKRRESKLPNGLLAIAFASLIFLILSRPDSPVWAIIILALLLLTTSRKVLGMIFKSKYIRYYLALSVVAFGLACCWIITQHATNVIASPHFPENSNSIYAVQQVLNRSQLFVNEMVGLLGWDNAPVPYLTIMIYIICIGFIILQSYVAMTKKNLKLGLSVLAAIAATFLVPLIYTLHTGKKQGYIVHGRYELPVAIGAILLASSLAGQVSVKIKRLSTLILSLVAFANIVGFVWVLRRFTVGNETLNIFKSVPNGWQPPISSVLIILMYALANIFTVLYLRKIVQIIYTRAHGDKTDSPALSLKAKSA